jgi:hypothetical protein
MKYFVTGGSGLIGRRLVQRILGRGDEAVVLTRDRAHCHDVGLGGSRIELVKGDGAHLGAWREQVAGAAVVVNLAGEGLFEKRWDDAEKAKIRATRVEMTKNIVAAIGNAPKDERPGVLVSASAVGYYGPRDDDEPLAESARAGSDFLAGICVEWEEAARMASAYGTRVVVLRLGVVLAADGGALARMVPAFRAFVGGPVGSGEQWFPWIHVDDAVGLILYAIDHPEVRGPVNAVAPSAVRAKEFAAALGAALGRPSWLKVPRFLLKLGLGEAADVVATGQRVVPKAATEAGYIFRYKELAPALADIVGARGR